MVTGLPSANAVPRALVPPQCSLKLAPGVIPLEEATDSVRLRSPSTLSPIPFRSLTTATYGVFSRYRVISSKQVRTELLSHLSCRAYVLPPALLAGAVRCEGSPPKARQRLQDLRTTSRIALSSTGDSAIKRSQVRSTVRVYSFESI